jgi:hypothetical protein
MLQGLSMQKRLTSVAAICVLLLALCLTATPQSAPSVTLASRLQTGAANNDLVGTVSVAVGTASASHTFSGNFAVAPVCVLTPTADGAAQAATSWWVVTTTTSVSAHTHNSVTGTTPLVFNYVCIGNPN